MEGGHSLVSIEVFNSLQLSIDDFVKVEESYYYFYHNGTMTVGNKGRIKNQRTIDFHIDKEPVLVDGSMIALGTVKKGTQLEWGKVRNLLLNLGVYALLRDDLRKIISSK